MRATKENTNDQVNSFPRTKSSSNQEEMFPLLGAPIFPTALYDHYHPRSVHSSCFIMGPFTARATPLAHDQVSVHDERVMCVQIFRPQGAASGHDGRLPHDSKIFYSELNQVTRQDLFCLPWETGKCVLIIGRRVKCIYGD